jgi:hypothetical protein
MDTDVPSPAYFWLHSIYKLLCPTWFFIGTQGGEVCDVSRVGREGECYRQEHTLQSVSIIFMFCVFPNHAMFRHQFPVNSSVCLANIRSLVCSKCGRGHSCCWFISLSSLYSSQFYNLTLSQQLHLIWRHHTLLFAAPLSLFFVPFLAGE